MRPTVLAALGLLLAACDAAALATPPAYPPPPAPLGGVAPALEVAEAAAPAAPAAVPVPELGALAPSAEAAQSAPAPAPAPAEESYMAGFTRRRLARVEAQRDAGCAPDRAERVSRMHARNAAVAEHAIVQRWEDERCELRGGEHVRVERTEDEEALALRRLNDSHLVCPPEPPEVARARRAWESAREPTAAEAFRWSYCRASDVRAGVKEPLPAR